VRSSDEKRLSLVGFAARAPWRSERAKLVAAIVIGVAVALVVVVAALAWRPEVTRR
jgi:hypothetical protein